MPQKRDFFNAETQRGRDEKKNRILSAPLLLCTFALNLMTLRCEMTK